MLVEDFRRLIEKRTGISNTNYFLIHASKVLEKGRTLSRYGIKRESTIDQCYALAVSRNIDDNRERESPNIVQRLNQIQRKARAMSEQGCWARGRRRIQEKGLDSTGRGREGFSVSRQWLVLQVGREQHVLP